MCGIFGIYDHEDAAKLTYFGLYALQHRGQESCGIVSSSGWDTFIHKGLGLVPDVFSEEILDGLKGHIAIGHVRYSTVGEPTLNNAVPVNVFYKGQHISITHNGNISNALELRRELENTGSIFQTTNDAEVILLLVINGLKNGIMEAVSNAMDKLKGSYSVIMLFGDQMIAFRDPYGFRPMCIGKLNGAHVIASETCAFDLIGAKYIGDITPGEVLQIDHVGIRSVVPNREMIKKAYAHCIFEHIYFARPDSIVYGNEVYEFRKRQGYKMWERHPLKADLVMPFPDSGMYAALGYAEASGIPFELGMIRNHYVGRTFIQPSQKMRDFGVKVKLNPVRSVIKGKHIVVIEDSIVRGTTAKTRVKTLREFGAKKISMIVSCPPHKHRCHYGIDFTSKELIASKKSVEQIKKFIGVDYLGYGTIKDQVDALGIPKKHLCFACFDGKNPSQVCDSFTKDCLER